MKYFLSMLLSVMLMANSVLTGYAQTRTEGNPEKGTKTEVQLQDVDPANYRSPRMHMTAPNEDEKTSFNGNVAQFADTDIVRVSILLESPSTIDKGYSVQNIAKNRKAVSYRKSLQKEQESITKRIEKTLGKSIDVKWNITLLANLISAEVEYGDIEKITKVAGVKKVILENRYQVEPVEETPDTYFTTEYMIFALETWENGYTGAGSVVAVVDTGINHNHIQFDADAFEYSLSLLDKKVDLLTVADIDAVLEQLNAKDRKADATAAELYKSSKIPFAFNYLAGNYNTDHASAGTGDHGSHVAGIAAGNRYVMVDGEYVDARETVKAVGVAPDAQLMAMQVFNQQGSTSDSDYMVAIEDALILGASSINLSLGAPYPGFTFNYEYQDFLNQVTQYGTLLVMSAGNAGSWNRASSTENVPDGYLYIEDNNWQMGGTPGIYENTLSVASADNVGSTAVYVKVNDEYYKYTDSAENAQVAGPRERPVTSIAGEHDFIFIEGFGNEKDYEAVNAVEPLEGKVVIVKRGGDVSFYLKGNRALPYNPVGIFVTNNEINDNFYMSIADYTGTAPMIMLPMALAAQIRKECEPKTADGITYYTGKIYISGANETHDFIASLGSAPVSSFSSWGVPGSLTMKPEITAPGGNINSAAGLTTDQFQIYSGTSMAAPHIAGMAAVVGQYVRENGLEEYTDGNPRTIINSLLMSTAFPMFMPSGAPYPVLQQGAGLADVLAATTAKSFIMMDENATSSYADGKVKVELGDDPDRTGKYSYIFNLTNISDETVSYNLFTYAFTQMPAINNDGTLLASPDTYYLDINEKYTVAIDYDVNKDDVTNTDDAQAILDYITGVVKAEDINLEVADVDGSGKIQALDARKLLQIIADSTSSTVTVQPGETVSVLVEFELAEDSEVNEDIKEYFYNGFYVEGYTFLEPADDEVEDVYHSIPIIGYYGNYTDASMFDKGVEQELYEGKQPYMEYTTNYPSVKYPGDKSYTIFTGNPYLVENGEYPRERLALSSNTLLKSLRYSLIRAAGSMAYELYTIIDGERETIASDWDYNLDAGFYYDQTETPSWMYNAPYELGVNSLVKDFGVTEGDKFGIRVVALPEYYAMQLTGNQLGVIPDAAAILGLRDDGTAGKGSELGFEFTVDDTAPELISVEYDKDNQTVTVTAKDNEYIAAIALTDVAGIFTYAAECPEQSEKGETVTVTFDLEGIEDNAVVVMVGDYAANETVKLAVLRDGPIQKRVPYYVLTYDFKPDTEYVISPSKTTGDSFAMNTNGAPDDYIYFNTVEPVTIINDEHGTYIPYGDVNDTILWKTEQYVQNGAAMEGYYYLISKDNGYYLSTAMGNNYRPFVYDKGYAAVLTYLDEENPYMLLTIGSNMGMLYWDASNQYYIASTRNYSPVYLYTLDYYLEEIENPQAATSIETDPESVFLILGAAPEKDIIAKVYPEYIDNREVSWESADTSIVTVDDKGHAVAVAEGQTTIRVTSKATPEVYVDVPVKVVGASPVDYKIFGVVTFDDASYPVQIDLSNMSMAAAGIINDTSIMGGGRSGKYMFFGGLNDKFSKYDISANFAQVDSFDCVPEYVPVDVASLPVGMGTVEGEVVPFDKYEMVAIAPDGSLMIMGDYQDETGAWQRILDAYTGLNEHAGFGKLLAVTFIGAYDADDTGSNTEFDYYAIDENGHLIYLYLTTDEDGYLDNEHYFYLSIGWFDFTSLFGAIEGMPLSDDISAYSLTYRVDVVDMGTEEEDDDIAYEYLYLADATTNSIYEIYLDTYNGFEANYVGTVDGVKRLSSLFDNNYDAVQNVTFSKLRQSVKKEEIAMFSKKPVPAAPLSFAKEAPAAAPVEEKAAEEPVEAPVAYVAGIDGITFAKMRAVLDPITVRKAEISGEKAEDDYAVTYTESVDVGSGVVTITYDPETTSFVKVDTDLEFTSVKDDENGKVIFSFANLEDIAAGEEIAVFHFTQNCEDTEITFAVTERDGDENSGDTSTIKIEGIGHDYQFEEMVWNEDHTAATAKLVCTRDPEHTKDVEAEVTVERVEPTTEKEGSVTYTATATYGDQTFTDIYTEVLDKLPSVPDTGDHSNNTVLIAVMAGCVVAIGCILFFLKKKRS